MKIPSQSLDVVVIGSAGVDTNVYFYTDEIDFSQDFIRYADILFFLAANHPDPTPLITRFLADNPARIVVVRMGAGGCALGTTPGGVQFFPPATLPEPVIDTNGAGDTLAVGFLSSYVLDGFSLEQSLLRGQIAARYTCTKKASSSDLITAEKLEYYWKRVVDK